MKPQKNKAIMIIAHIINRITLKTSYSDSTAPLATLELSFEFALAAFLAEFCFFVVTF